MTAIGGKRFRAWFFEGMKPSAKVRDEKSPWPAVMCLTGLDYFGSLGYAPGIAALAAGLLAPQATLVLVLLTLFGALPMYRRVAEKSPHGQGSISMLEKLVPGWGGKALILCLIGFAATDFIITITLSAADAAAHIAENSYVKALCAQNHHWNFLEHRMSVTFGLLSVLLFVFMLGFKEAVQLAVVIVSLFLLLNVGVTCAGFNHLLHAPQLLSKWEGALHQNYGNIFDMIKHSLLVFPALALGMSGFETGVTVMPIIKSKDESESNPVDRIAKAKTLLVTAAVIMSSFLFLSAVMTTLLIPQAAFKAGGVANGRALAYIAHQYLGDIYGTCYDVSTILILWFSGASSMAGLLSLVPRYLPRFGMAPAWARATRPLVIFFGLVSFAVTYWFKADVDAQGGAYATGVLVLMTSAAVAVFLSQEKQNYLARIYFFCVAAIFCYTTVMNVAQRPEGLHIASFFILCIFIISVISRTIRSTELRTRKVVFDDNGRALIERSQKQPLFVIAHAPGPHNYHDCDAKARAAHFIDTKDAPQIVFLEISIADSSEFQEDALQVACVEIEGFNVLQCKSNAVPNAIASILLALRGETHAVPHLFLYWSEGNPLSLAVRYLFLGDGETGPLTREVLRCAEPNEDRRPHVHIS